MVKMLTHTRGKLLALGLSIAFCIAKVERVDAGFGALLSTFELNSWSTTQSTTAPHVNTSFWAAELYNASYSVSLMALSSNGSLTRIKSFSPSGRNGEFPRLFYDTSNTGPVISLYFSNDGWLSTYGSSFSYIPSTLVCLKNSPDVFAWSSVTKTPFLCPASRAQLVCKNQTLEYRGVATYSTFSNGNFLLTIFFDGQDSVVCMFEIAGNGLRTMTVASLKTYSGASITNIVVSDQSSTKSLLLFLVTNTGTIFRSFLSKNGPRYDMSDMVGMTFPGSAAPGSVSTFIDNKLVVPAGNKLYVLDALDTCDSNATCKQCTTWKGRYCGWCYGSSSCTVQSNCAYGWFPADPYSSPVCPSISPKSVSRSYNGSITLNIALNGPGNKCKFSPIGMADTLTTFATVSTNGVFSCPAPTASDFHVNGTFTVVLNLFDSDDRTVLLVADFTYFDCANQTSCSTCVLAHHSCTWCRNENLCTSDIAAKCPSDSVLSTVSFSNDTQKCPRVTGVGPQLLACTDVLEVININVSNFPTTASANYHCRITALDATVIPGRRDGVNMIACEGALCNTTMSQFQKNVDVTLWRVDKTPNVDVGEMTATVTLYNCNILKSCLDCTRKRRTAGFNCVWCRTGGCLYNVCPSANDAFNTCPSLDIDTTKMKTASLVDGGDNFTLSGWGLGNGSMEQVRNSITFNNMLCPVIFYQKLSDQSALPDSMVCSVPRSPARGQVNVTVTIEGVTWQKTNGIYYYDPEIVSVANSSFGLVSGGTKTLVRGFDLNYLDASADSLWLYNQRESAPIACSLRKNSSTLMDCTTMPVVHAGRYNFALMLMGRPQRNFSAYFTYYPDPVTIDIQPNPPKGSLSGGQELRVSGRNFNGVVNTPLMIMTSSSTPESRVSQPCLINSSTVILCTVPNTTSLYSNRLPNSWTLSFVADQLTLADMPSNLRTLVVYPDPQLETFTKPKQYAKQVVLNGVNLNYVFSQQNVTVLVASVPCTVNELGESLLVFVPPTADSLVNETAFDDKVYNITVRIGNFQFYPGSITYVVPNITASIRVPPDALPPNKELIIGISCGGAVMIAIILAAAFLYRRKARYHQRQYRKSIQQLNQMEINVRNECKQAFAELQADMTNLTNDMVVTGIPYWDYGNFTYKILFPGTGNSQSLSRLTTKSKGSTVLAMNKFELLVCSRSFLSMFIHTLEEQESFTVADRVSVASLVMLILQNKMDYATLVLKDLLSHLIRAKVKKTNAKLLLRSSESVVERMLTHWLSLCLYKYIQDFAGMPLFLLYKAIKQQVEKGPVDAITQEARYSLSEERLLREKVDARSLTLSVIQEFSNDLLPCKVLDCDSISQVKEKILDGLYRNTAHSLRPCAADYTLVWQPSLAGIPIDDEDSTSEIVAGWKRLNTLAHYSVPDQAVVQLVPRTASLGTHSSRKSKFGSSDVLVPPHQPHHVMTTERHSVVNKWHLSKHRQQTLPKEKQQETLVSEIFLTRLVKTKGTLQEFIDKLFSAIFSADRLPPVVKFLFDFLDEEYKACGLNDPEVLHIWKNNSLHLRFWINIIKNPDFVFDVGKSPIVDSCLSVVAQTLIDSCSTSEADYGADAPVNKLLFAKDRPRYRKMVETFYSDIRNGQHTNEQELSIYLNSISSMYPKDFYRSSALQELYQYAKKYLPQLLSKLDEDGGEKSYQVKMSLLHINEILDTVNHHGFGSVSQTDNSMYSFV